MASVWFWLFALGALLFLWGGATMALRRIGPLRELGRIAKLPRYAPPGEQEGKAEGELRIAGRAEAGETVPDLLDGSAVLFSEVRVLRGSAAKGNVSWREISSESRRAAFALRAGEAVLRVEGGEMLASPEVYGYRTGKLLSPEVLRYLEAKDIVRSGTFFKVEHRVVRAGDALFAVGHVGGSASPLLPSVLWRGDEETYRRRAMREERGRLVTGLWIAAIGLFYAWLTLRELLP